MEYKKADVALLYLPSGPDGRKIGLDDYFAASHTVEDLMHLATRDLRRPLHDAFYNGEENCEYIASPQGMTWCKPTKDGIMPVPLTNFTAQIVNEVVEDDGVELRRHYEIEASCRHRSTRFFVPSALFPMMNWVPEHLGASAYIYPGISKKDHARVAIQVLSKEPPQQLVFTHAGWRRLNSNKWVYLHGGGAIGSGAAENMKVQLPSTLDGFRLPAPPVQGDLIDAVNASRQILELGDEICSVALFAALYRAALGQVDFSVFLTGPSGVFKSEVAALIQQHFGPGLDARHLPAAWTSTDNALEGLAFVAKDAVLVVDDFAPRGTTQEIQRLHSKADRLLRAQGNNSARGRMNADSSLQKLKPPRGLILSTGEDTPQGHSLRSRQLILEVEPGAICVEQLSRCQQDAREGLYAQAMSGYLYWLSSRYESIHLSLRDRINTLRQAIYEECGFQAQHRRTPEIIANLAMGLSTFCNFAQESGVLCNAEGEKLWKRGWKALLVAGEHQAGHMEGGDPARRYISLLMAGIAAGRAHLANARGKRPVNPGTWGWRDICPDTAGAVPDWKPQGERIGWLDKGNVYLNPDAAYNVAKRMGSESGDGIVIGSKTLHKRLQEEGFLKAIDKSRRTLTIRKVIEGRRQEVLHLHSSTLCVEKPAQSDHSPADFDHPEAM